MLLQEAYTELAERVGFSASNSSDKTKMLRAIRNALKFMYREYSAIALTQSSSFDTVDGTYLYYLDCRANYIDSARLVDSDSNSSMLEVIDLNKFRHDYVVPDLTDTDQPSYLIPIKRVWVQAQPTSASVIAVVSSSASDTAVHVSIRGISGGLEKTEKLTLTGTTPVNSTNSYTSLLSITKDVTVGTVTCTSNSAAVTNISLTANQYEKSYWEIQLFKTPDAVYTVYYDFSPIPWSISEDEDLIPIDDMLSDILISLAESEILRRRGNANWQSAKSLATSDLEKAIDSDHFAENIDKRMSIIDIQESMEGDRWD